MPEVRWLDAVVVLLFILLVAGDAVRAHVGSCAPAITHETACSSWLLEHFGGLGMRLSVLLLAVTVYWHWVVGAVLALAVLSDLFLRFGAETDRKEKGASA